MTNYEKYNHDYLEIEIMPEFRTNFLTHLLRCPRVVQLFIYDDADAWLHFMILRLITDMDDPNASNIKFLCMKDTVDKHCLREKQSLLPQSISR